MGANCVNVRSCKQTSNVPKPVVREKKNKKFKIEETGITDIDKIFEPAKNLLETLGVQKKKLKDAYKQLKSLTKVKMLKDPQIEDVIKAMLYIYSAGSKGNLESVGLEISEEDPYVRVDELSLRIEHKEIARQWNSFIKELNKINPIVSQLLRRLCEESQTVEGLSEIAKEVSNSLKIADRVAFNETVNSNLAKINNAPKVIAHIFEFEADVKQRMSAFVHDKFAAMGGLKHFQEVGRQAHHATVYDPKKIIMAYWPEEGRIS